MMSRHLLIVAWSFFVTTCIPAEDATTVSSPDKNFEVRFHGSNPSRPESFTIENSKGEVLLDSKSCGDLAGVLNFEPERVLWSPDSQTVAIAGGYSKNLKTYLFSLDGKTFASIPVPWLTDRYDNPWVLPLRWIKGRRLIVTISGPHAGKADGHGYRGRATLHIPAKSKSCETHFRYITEHRESLSD